jgi:hypothetical protein
MRRRNAIPRNEREAQAKERALAALSLMRRKAWKFGPAAKAAGTTPKTVWRYAGSALRQQRRGGHVHAASHDRISRRLNFISPAGKLAGTVRDSRTASAIGEHLNAVKAFINNRADSLALKTFEGKSFRVSGQVYPFVTDAETLEKLADAGELVFEGLYKAVKG